MVLTKMTGEPPAPQICRQSTISSTSSTTLLIGDAKEHKVNMLTGSRAQHVLCISGGAIGGREPRRLRAAWTGGIIGGVEGGAYACGCDVRRRAGADERAGGGDGGADFQLQRRGLAR